MLYRRESLCGHAFRGGVRYDLGEAFPGQKSGYLAEQDALSGGLAGCGDLFIRAFWLWRFRLPGRLRFGFFCII